MKEYIVRCENNKFTIEGEIVRCKDCKWFDVNRANFVEGYGYCEQYEVTDKDSHYCSYGERKEEKQVTSKLNNLDDFLLREKSKDCKEQKSKLESDTISRQAAIEAVEKAVFKGVAKSAIESLPPVEDMGEVSDGYHTFNQLYHQRAVLFATIVNQNKDKAWKSWKHEDGKFCFDKDGEWFIVGVDTPEGSYTYHYEKKYWDMFGCEELDRGKHWDGHTEEDVTRLLSLPPAQMHDKHTETHGVCLDCISRADTIKAMCSKCVINRECIGECSDVVVIKNMPPVEPERPTL